MARCQDGMRVEEVASLSGCDTDSDRTSLSGSEVVGESAPLSSNGMGRDNGSPHERLIPPVRMCACGGTMGCIQTRWGNYGWRGCGKDCLFPRDLEVRVTLVGVSAVHCRLTVFVRARRRMGKGRCQCITEERDNLSNRTCLDAPSINSLVAGDARKWVSDKSGSGSSDTGGIRTSDPYTDPSYASWTPTLDTYTESPSSSSRASDSMCTFLQPPFRMLSLPTQCVTRTQHPLRALRPQIGHPFSLSPPFF